MFDGSTRRIASTPVRTLNPDGGLHFDNGAQALRRLLSRSAIDGILTIAALPPQIDYLHGGI